MRVHELSQEAKLICQNNYKVNCGRCPLRPVCVTTPRLTEESHIKWINPFNMAQKAFKKPLGVGTR